jgi:hypothetical protein
MKSTPGYPGYHGITVAAASANPDNLDLASGQRFHQIRTCFALFVLIIRCVESEKFTNHSFILIATAGKRCHPSAPSRIPLLLVLLP